MVTDYTILYYPHCINDIHQHISYMHYIMCYKAIYTTIHIRFPLTIYRAAIYSTYQFSVDIHSPSKHTLSIILLVLYLTDYKSNGATYCILQCNTRIQIAHTNTLSYKYKSERKKYTIYQVKNLGLNTRQQCIECEYISFIFINMRQEHTNHQQSRILQQYS